MISGPFIPAEDIAHETTIEGTDNGYIVTASRYGKVFARSFFCTGGVLARVQGAYEEAKSWLESYEPQCQECRSYFAPSGGARCSCGQCRS